MVLCLTYALNAVVYLTLITISIDIQSLFTLVGRVADGMVLVASHDDNSLQDLKQQAKRLLKSFKPTSPAKCTIDPNGPYHFCYVIEQGVCYLTLAEKSYPKKLAFQFLEQLAKEFSEAHQAEVARYSRPFAAVAFGTF
jgi:vesicle transport protein SEC22